MSALLLLGGGLASCPVGFMPPECQAKCGPGYFGISCASRCSPTCVDRACHPDTGFCYKCQAGFTGSKCSTRCRQGLFGDGCSKACPLNCFRNMCDPFTGFCGKCLKGYEGVQCEKQNKFSHSRLQSGHDDRTVADQVRKTNTGGHVVIYIIVVVISCSLPVCAVVVCIKFAEWKVRQDNRFKSNGTEPQHNQTYSTPNVPRPARPDMTYKTRRASEKYFNNCLDPDEANYLRVHFSDSPRNMGPIFTRNGYAPVHSATVPPRPQPFQSTLLDNCKDEATFRAPSAIRRVFAEVHYDDADKPEFNSTTEATPLLHLNTAANHPQNDVLLMSGSQISCNDSGVQRVGESAKTCPFVQTANEDRARNSSRMVTRSEMCTEHTNEGDDIQGGTSNIPGSREHPSSETYTVAAGQRHRWAYIQPDRQDSPGDSLYEDVADLDSSSWREIEEISKGKTTQVTAITDQTNQSLIELNLFTDIHASRTDSVMDNTNVVMETGTSFEHALLGNNCCDTKDDPGTKLGLMTSLTKSETLHNGEPSGSRPLCALPQMKPTEQTVEENNGGKTKTRIFEMDKTFPKWKNKCLDLSTVDVSTLNQCDQNLYPVFLDRDVRGICVFPYKLCYFCITDRANGNETNSGTAESLNDFNFESSNVANCSFNDQYPCAGNELISAVTCQEGGRTPNQHISPLVNGTINNTDCISARYVSDKQPMITLCSSPLLPMSECLPDKLHYGIQQKRCLSSHHACQNSPPLLRRTDSAPMKLPTCFSINDDILNKSQCIFLPRKCRSLTSIVDDVKPSYAIPAGIPSVFSSPPKSHTNHHFTNGSNLTIHNNVIDLKVPNTETASTPFPTRSCENGDSVLNKSGVNCGRFLELTSQNEDLESHNKIVNCFCSTKTIEPSQWSTKTQWTSPPTTQDQWTSPLATQDQWTRPSTTQTQWARPLSIQTQWTSPPGTQAQYTRSSATQTQWISPSTTPTQWISPSITPTQWISPSITPTQWISPSITPTQSTCLCSTETKRTGRSRHTRTHLSVSPSRREGIEDMNNKRSCTLLSVPHWRSMNPTRRNVQLDTQNSSPLTPKNAIKMTVKRSPVYKVKMNFPAKRNEHKLSSTCSCHTDTQGGELLDAERLSAHYSTRCSSSVGNIWYTEQVKHREFEHDLKERSLPLSDNPQENANISLRTSPIKNNLKKYCWPKLNRQHTGTSLLNDTIHLKRKPTTSNSTDAARRVDDEDFIFMDTLGYNNTQNDDGTGAAYLETVTENSRKARTFLSKRSGSVIDKRRLVKFRVDDAVKGIPFNDEKDAHDNYIGAARKAIQNQTTGHDKASSKIFNDRCESRAQNHLPGSSLHVKNYLPENHLHTKKDPPENGIHVQNVLPESLLYAQNVLPESHLHAQNVLPESHLHAQNVIPEKYLDAHNDLPESHVHARKDLPESHVHDRKDLPESHVHARNDLPQSQLHHVPYSRRKDNPKQVPIKLGSDAEGQVVSPRCDTLLKMKSTSQLGAYPLPSLLEEIEMFDQVSSVDIHKTEYGYLDTVYSDSTVTNSYRKIKQSKTSEFKQVTNTHDLLCSGNTHSHSESEMKNQLNHEEENICEVLPAIAQKEVVKKSASSDHKQDHRQDHKKGHKQSTREVCKREVNHDTFSVCPEPDKKIKSQHKGDRHHINRYYSMAEDTSECFYDALEHVADVSPVPRASRHHRLGESSRMLNEGRHHRTELANKSALKRHNFYSSTNKVESRTASTTMATNVDMKNQMPINEMPKSSTNKRHIAFRFAPPTRTESGSPGYKSSHNSSRRNHCDGNTVDISKNERSREACDVTRKPTNPRRLQTATQCLERPSIDEPQCERTHSSSKTDYQCRTVHKPLSSEKDNTFSEVYCSSGDDFYSFRES